MRVRYIVSVRQPFASDWTKSWHDSMASVLRFAWRKHKRGCSVDNISHLQEIILNKQDLMQAIAEMDTLLQDQPKLSLDEIAAQAIHKMDQSKVLYS